VFADRCSLVRSVSVSSHFTWSSVTFQVFWSDNGDLVSITTDESFYILKFDQSKLEEAKENPELVTEDGIADVFSEVGLFIAVVVFCLFMVNLKS